MITKLTMHSLVLTAIMLLFTASSCKKEAPRHRDVFRCEIDGVPWEAGCDSQNLVWSCDYLDCQYYEDSGGFSIGANNDYLKNGLSMRKFAGSGGLQIGDNQLSSATFGLINEGISYNMKEDYPGLISLTNIDPVKKIIECSFYFKAYTNTGDSINITNGYFKVKYRP